MNIIDVTSRDLKQLSGLVEDWNRNCDARQKSNPLFSDRDEDLDVSCDYKVLTEMFLNNLPDLTENDRIYAAVDVGGEIQGLMTLRTNFNDGEEFIGKGKAVWIDHLFVAPEHLKMHGAPLAPPKKGIGKALTQFAISVAKLSGYVAVGLKALNEESKGFFKAQGFRKNESLSLTQSLWRVCF